MQNHTNYNSGDNNSRFHCYPSTLRTSSNLYHENSRPTKQDGHHFYACVWVNR